MTIINILLFVLLACSSFILSNHLKKVKTATVVGENEVDQWYDIYITKKIIWLKRFNLFMVCFTSLIAMFEFIITQYYAFLKYNGGIKFLKPFFMNFYLDYEILIDNKADLIAMIITLVLVFLAVFVNLFFIGKLYKGFNQKMIEFLSENVPMMYRHVKFKPFYHEKRRQIIMIQDKFNQFTFDQNKHSFNRYFKGVKNYV